MNGDRCAWTGEEGVQSLAATAGTVEMALYACSIHQEPHARVVSYREFGWLGKPGPSGVAGARRGTIGLAVLRCGEPVTSITAGPGNGRRLFSQLVP